MKARTAVHLVGGPVIRTTGTFEDMCHLWAQMTRSQAGSVFEIDHVTGHGSIKRVGLLAGTIYRLEEL